MKVGILGMMFLIMFTLKLAGPLAGTSWAIITAPLWVPFAIVALIFIVGAIGAILSMK